MIASGQSSTDSFGAGSAKSVPGFGRLNHQMAGSNFIDDPPSFDETGAPDRLHLTSAKGNSSQGGGRTEGFAGR